MTTPKQFTNGPDTHIYEKGCKFVEESELIPTHMFHLDTRGAAEQSDVSTPTCMLGIQPPALLAEDLTDYGINEKKNIVKEKTRNRNQPYAFMGGGDHGEQLALDMFGETIGSASKGGVAFDNKTLDKDNKLVSAKEVKFVSLIGTKQCKDCKKKCPYFQKTCLYCKSDNFKYISDSRASISSEAHIKYKDIMNDYIIFVQDFDNTKQIINIRCYKFLSKNSYFNTYIQNQYDSGNKKGGTCNFVPYSYDWFMSGPISILNVDINISNTEPEIIYHLYNPLSDIYDDLPNDKLEELLNSNEKTIILDKTRLTNGCFKYDYIKDIFKLRPKTIGKSRGSTSRK